MLSKDNLVEIYEIFADVQGLDIGRDDKIFLRGKGFKRLKLTGYMNYHPFDGVRFSVTDSGGQVECTGYGICAGQGLRSKMLKERVAEYLARRK